MVMSRIVLWTQNADLQFPPLVCLIAMNDSKTNDAEAPK